MKKRFALLMAVIMMVGLMTACGGGQSDDSVQVSLDQIGSSLALQGKFDNVSDNDVSATITVTWYDADETVLGYSVSEIPYIMAGDTAFDVFNFDEVYDHYDVAVETGEVSDEAKSFYDNLTIESTENADGTIDFKVGGGNGEKFKADVTVIYTNQEDEPIAFDTKRVKGSDVVTGSFKGCKSDDCAGYRMVLIPAGMM